MIARGDRLADASANLAAGAGRLNLTGAECGKFNQPWFNCPQGLRI
jgi:hypothetical protein